MDFTSLLETAGPALHILQDPALPRISRSISALHDIEQRSPSTSVRLGKLVPGVGLTLVAKPLEIFVQARRSPTLAMIAVAAVIAVPLLISYKIGKSRKRR